MGHRDLLVTQTYLSSKATTAPFVPREASAAGWLRSNAVTSQVGPGTQVSDFPTYQESDRAAEVRIDSWTPIRRRVDAGRLLVRGLVSNHRKTRHPMTCRI